MVDGSGLAPYLKPPREGSDGSSSGLTVVIYCQEKTYQEGCDKLGSIEQPKQPERHSRI
jgi:hypothetical protein